MSPNYEQLDLPSFDSDNNEFSDEESEVEVENTKESQEVGESDNQNDQDNKNEQSERDSDDVFKRAAERLRKLEEDDTAYDDLYGRTMR